MADVGLRGDPKLCQYHFPACVCGVDGQIARLMMYVGNQEEIASECAATAAETRTVRFLVLFLVK